MQAIELYADSNRGIYIPQHFAETASENWQEIAPNDKEILLAGPDHEQYWDAWERVLQFAWYADVRGNQYVLWQDGDLWCICEELMTAEERHNFGFDE